MNEPDPILLPATAAPAQADLDPAACAARLAELFPAVFTPGAPKPLKLRIQGDIQQRAPGVFTKRSLSAFLHRHTTSNAYLRALVAAPTRSDLDGAPAGEVSAEHRDAAQAELDRRRALRDVKREAEWTARREVERDERREARAVEREATKALRADEAARREREALARAWHAATLSRANFCALKGITEAQLDAALAQPAQGEPIVRHAPRPDRPRHDRPLAQRPRRGKP